MEIVSPPLLTAVQEVRWSLSSGRSMSESVRLYLDHHGDEVASELRERWILKGQGPSTTQRPALPFRNHYRKALWELIERGLAGQPVLEALSALEWEVQQAAQQELEQHLSVLPFKVLMPLLLFQFPAYLLLLVLPLLRDLNLHLGGP